MPMPHPGPDEAQAAFVSRFMEDARMQADYPDEKQRLAVAYSKWQELKKSVLDAAARKKIPHADFAGPDESYPIEDEAHARNALARAAQNGDPALIARVKAAVRKKFPNIAVDGEQTSKSRRIRALDVTRIALCKQGKNGFTTVLKGDGQFCLETIAKAVGPNELLAVVYAPNQEDDDGHFASAEVIKSACHSYNRDHRSLDIEHDGRILSNEDAYVAESFIVAKGDERFSQWKRYDGQPAGDLTGAWATLVKLENPVLQKACRNGDLDGVSLFGQAAFDQTDTKAASKRVADSLGKSRDATQETDMELKELRDELSGFKAEIVAMVKSAIKGEEKPAEQPVADAAPAFTGDPNSASDLENFEKSLRTYELNKSLKSGKLTADKVAELRKALSAVEPSDEEAGVEEGDSAEVRSLKTQLFKAKRRSNAPEAPVSGDDNAEAVAKAATDEGLAIAAAYNEQRGSGRASGMRLVKS